MAIEIVDLPVKKIRGVFHGFFFLWLLEGDTGEIFDDILWDQSIPFGFFI